MIGGGAAGSGVTLLDGMTPGIKETYWLFEAAELLCSEKHIADFLAVVAEDGNQATMALAVGAVARARSMTEIAMATKTTREGLHKALSPGGNPSLSTVAKVARALGVEISFRVKPSTEERVRPAARGKAPKRLPAAREGKVAKVAPGGA